MKRDLLELASSLTRRGISFVMATVVRREGGTPALLGDMALVTSEGAVHGWIGSAKIFAMIEREALRALLERKPQLICLSSWPERNARSGVLQLQLPLDSEGLLEVYLAPIIAAPRLLLVGRSPILTSLAALSRAIGYRVDVVMQEPRSEELQLADRVFGDYDDPRLFESDGFPLLMVVAPQDKADVEIIAAALAMAPTYLGVLASRRRFTLLRDTLTNRGLGADVDHIANPAGLALGAHDAGEVAVAILAQIIARRNGVVAVNEASVTLSEASEETSTMDVVVDDAEEDSAPRPAADASPRVPASGVPLTTGAAVTASASRSASRSSPMATPLSAGISTGQGSSAAAAGAAPSPSSHAALLPSALAPPLLPPAAAAVVATMPTAATTTPGGTPAATASCFPAPPPRDEESGAVATVALKVRASSPSLELRAAGDAREGHDSGARPRPGDARVVITASGGAPTTPSDGTPVAVGGAESEAVDPVCQSCVAIQDAVHVARWQGRSWYFCSGECRARFFANPLRYSAFAPGLPERS